MRFWRRNVPTEPASDRDDPATIEQTEERHQPAHEPELKEEAPPAAEPEASPAGQPAGSGQPQSEPQGWFWRRLVPTEPVTEQEQEQQPAPAQDSELRDLEPGPAAEEQSHLPPPASFEPGPAAPARR